MACSITNIGECVAEAVFGLILDILNSASRPFLDLIKKFLIEPVSVTAFVDIWAIIVYILSMFYGILIVWIGLKFIISGESPEQREKAKSDLKSIIIMMILVQGSYHLYDLFLAISASLTEVVFDMISNNFFRLSLESISNFGFDLIFGFIYILHLIIVLVLVLLRYIFVSAGVILFAIGVFFYFLPPLNQYGKLILNSLGVLIFLPFFYSIIFLIGSKISQLSQFNEMKTLIMVGTLDLIILSTVLLLLFVIFKAATKVKKVTNILK
ncbi:MAG: hypothetical protein KKF48_05455 [Nanoarchaeota archaeon]|nr:hypothetical protein [Nanoarchaeota archaeon]MBU1028463.1 hypothetical protein [Nanoarchaeota archaeon]